MSESKSLSCWSPPSPTTPGLLVPSTPWRRPWPDAIATLRVRPGVVVFRDPDGIRLELTEKIPVKPTDTCAQPANPPPLPGV